MIKVIIFVLICGLAAFFYAKSSSDKYMGEVDNKDFQPLVEIKEIEGRDVLDFVFEDHKGDEVYLNKFKGVKIIVNLWASWCAPCLKELPELDKLQGLYPETLKVITLNIESDASNGVISFDNMQLEHLEFYYDHNQYANSLLEIMGLPTSIILDKDLIVEQKISGYLDWQGEKAKELLNMN